MIRSLAAAPKSRLVYFKNACRSLSSLSTIRNPATGEIVAEVPVGGAAEVTAAVEAADAAFSSWSKMEPCERARILNRTAELLRRDLGELAEMETRATGRPIREYKAQLGRVPSWFEYHAALAQTMEGTMPPFFGSEDHHAYVRRVPLGVVALVTSFNHPLLISSKKISVALAAGNTAVVKPPPAAPLTILKLAELMKEAGLPDGVLNVVPSTDVEAGNVLTTHPAIAKVDLTGGNVTGRILGEAAGKSVKRFTAELGGNAPVIVFADAPSIDAAVNGVAFAAFVASGQTCVSAKRIIIAEEIYDEFVA